MTEFQPSGAKPGSTDCGSVDLLREALHLDPAPGAVSLMRLKLLGDKDALPKLVSAADQRMLLSALLQRLFDYELIDDTSAHADGLERQLGAAWQAHINRRRQLADGLVEIISSLNAAGITPLLMKGAVSLWTGQPAWRQQRDIDILVAPDDSTRAHRLLTSIGFAPMPDQNPAPHHLQPIIRPDIPASIEIHFAASNPRGERYLSTCEFMQHSQRSQTPDGTVMLPGPVEHLLHMVVHNHFTHRNATFGVAPLKGLYEFAWQISQASPDDVRAMHHHATRDARLLAALELWFAAAINWFGVQLPNDIKIPQDAVSRWARQAERLRHHRLPSLTTALAEEISMIRARSRGVSGFVQAFWDPLKDLATAPIWIDRKEQALKSAGIDHG